MITLHQEADVNRLLLAHGVPVPVVHGMIDDISPQPLAGAGWEPT